MVVKVICKHSGIEFEAKSTRTTQHPAIADMKANANKRGNYGKLMEALDSVKANGGYTTIEEFLALVNQQVNASIKAQSDFDKEVAAMKREAAAEREEKKRILRENGYTWHQILEGEDQAQEWTWILSAPDGRIVSVSQAMAEIERGADVVQAEIEAKQEAIEAAGELNKQARRSNEAIYAEFDKAIATVTAGMVEVDVDWQQVSYERSPIRLMPELDIPYGCIRAPRYLDHILSGTINGVSVVVTQTHTNLMDDGIFSCWMREEDAKANGFTYISDIDDPLGLNKTLSHFFG